VKKSNLFKATLCFTAVFMVLSMSVWAGGGQEGGGEVPPGGVGVKAEAPMLAAMVAAGELPPVEERLPPDPIIKEPLNEIGQYSDKATVFATSGGPWFDMGQENLNGPQFLTIKEDGTLAPGLMVDWKFSDDFMSITYTLREGMKWSDGVPITIDDVLFSYLDLHKNENVSTWTGNIADVVRIDDWTFRIEYERANPKAPEQSAGQGSWQLMPKHYLKKWHIDHNPDADKLANDEGFDFWYDAIYHHFWWSPLKDITKPVFQPWVTTKSDSAVMVMERNPYYPVVDTAGQQLPYFDRVVAQIVDQEAYNLKVISGEADIAFMNTSFENFTLYKENEGEGDYFVYELPGFDAVTMAVIFYMLGPDKAKKDLFWDIRFRRALSVAMNREEINELVYFGKGVPRQAAIRPGPSWYNPEWATTYAQYDPKLANQLLDEVGLTKRDSRGFRLNLEGETLLLVLEFGSPAQYTKPLELIREYWGEVGVDAVVRPVDGSLAREHNAQEIADFAIRGIGSDGNFAVTMWARSWEFWCRAQDRIDAGLATMDDYPKGLPGIEPPQWVKDIHSWFVLRNALRPDSQEAIDLSLKINEWQAENLFALGTVGMIPILVIGKNDIGNVPTKFGPGDTWAGALNHHSDQLYRKK
jgi:peptide/nickel transport system substrate-binding protein